ncbi:REP-associated tyrosine transposase [Hyphomonas sp.]|uniref:REP-associated tyrosine transposase n=1 Tax=Hyphomonas sp. TaxID=87 RepID=UPI00391B0E59
MPEYRRLYSDGGTYFFTVNLEDRKSDLLVSEISKLRAAYSYVQSRHPFRTDAICILPDHIHCVWTLPEGDSDFSKRWMLLKSFFSRAITGRVATSGSRARRGEKTIWQRRFWEHLIRNNEDFEAHIGYTYENPVKHGYTSRAEDWPHSSLHRDLVHFASLTAPYKDMFTPPGERL